MTKVAELFFYIEQLRSLRILELGTQFLTLERRVIFLTRSEIVIVKIPRNVIARNRREIIG